MVVKVVEGQSIEQITEKMMVHLVCDGIDAVYFGKNGSLRLGGQLFNSRQLTDEMKEWAVIALAHIEEQQRIENQKKEEERKRKKAEEAEAKKPAKPSDFRFNLGVDISTGN